MSDDTWFSFLCQTFLFYKLKTLLHLFCAYVFIFVHHVYTYIMVGTHTPVYLCECD